MEDNIIEVKNLVKKYKINERKHGIFGYIKNLFHPKYKEFTAVNNISFSVKKGELVRIYWRKWSSENLLQ